MCEYTCVVLCWEGGHYCRIPQTWDPIGGLACSSALRESPLSRQPPQVVTSLVGGPVYHHPDSLSPVTSSFRVTHLMGRDPAGIRQWLPTQGSEMVQSSGEDTLESDA